MFHYKILWFYQDFKSENLPFLNLYSVQTARIPQNTGPITRGHVKSSELRNETPLQL